MRYFLRLRQLLYEHREELARLITTEMGKILDDARGEVQRGIENVETTCAVPSMMMGYGLQDGGARGIDEEVVYEPLGVFAAICPFNFPFMIPFWFWPYAIACGNTFIVKPSEQVPLTQKRVFELVHEVGFPPGVINLINGARNTVNALIDHPQIKGISFVGSSVIAEYVYARASACGKRVQASGGAKNALVVMPDADLDTCLSNMLGSIYGAAGQRCLAGSYITPVDAAYDEVRRRLVVAARTLRVGDGLEDGVDMGPVISASARERIIGAIGSGSQEGAQVILDGRSVYVADRPKGYFLGPTVLDGIRPQMGIQQEEIFGPVASLLPVESLEEAIEIINASPYGNAASIYTRNGLAARKFRYDVQAGNIGVNVGVAAPVANFPFGGRKRSFFGTLHGQGGDAVRFFTDCKIVITRWI
jgi:malonate-semialdehyde dehydrogenase (acetylating)/methylmalonate-semialdehyde dehydrogenase